MGRPHELAGRGAPPRRAAQHRALYSLVLTDEVHRQQLACGVDLEAGVLERIAFAVTNQVAPVIDAATSIDVTLFHWSMPPCAATASSSRSLTCLREQVGVFGDVVTDRGSRLPRELFDVVGGSVVASGAVQ